MSIDANHLLQRRLGAAMFPALALAAVTACSSPTAPPADVSKAQPPVRHELYSEPTEYRAAPPSAELGHAHFARYGVGDPYGAGVPYPVYRAFMAEFPDLFADSFGALSRKFGFIPHPTDPKGLPVGFHLTTDPNTGVDFLMTNCQVCHAGRVRTKDGEQVVEGLGNRQVRIHAYANAFAQLTDDERFTGARMDRASLREAKRLGLTWPRAYRGGLVHETMKAIVQRFGSKREQYARLAAGLPGRTATISGFSLAMEHNDGRALALPEVLGWTRIPDVAVARYRETNSYDGITVGAPVALVAGADFAFGVRPRWYDEHRHISTSMLMYMRQFERKLPFPGEIDQELAGRGYGAFEQRCARCHGHYARPGESARVSYRERVVPAAVVATDRARLDAVSDAFLAAANRMPATAGLTVTRRSGGWVPRPLLQVWARGQYGHNGQWPDLKTLATPPPDRPSRYVVMPDAALDLERVGQRWRPVSSGPPGAGEYLYDGTKPGYGVQGHTFLSDAPEPERDALLEYLKTL